MKLKRGRGKVFDQRLLTFSENLLCSPSEILEMIADRLSKSGWSWGCVTALNSEGRPIRIADTHRDDAKRFIVRADEKLTAFLELEGAVCIDLRTEQV
jgi:hypothetical protein